MAKKNRRQAQHDRQVQAAQAKAQAVQAEQTPAPVQKTETAVSVPQQRLLASFRTNSGKSYHRKGCRFVSGGNVRPCTLNTADQKLTACAVCKPHLAEAPATATPRSKDNTRSLGSCALCCKGSGLKSADEAVKAGFKVTKSGTKYHTAQCKHSGGPGVRQTPAPRTTTRPANTASTTQAPAVAF